jgi:rSAM/selenodomain-associated transferase 2
MQSAAPVTLLMPPPPGPAFRISIVLPALQEAAGIKGALRALEPLRRQGHEVIVVDGGSTDGTETVARADADAVLMSERGRARQMNTGAQHATGEVLLFLHADTVLPTNAAQAIGAAMSAGARWGRFDVRIAGRSAWFPVIAAAMNLRSRLTGIATGDQAIFVQRDWFLSQGGYAEIPLMEDIELTRRLRRLANPACLRELVLTSGRRWERGGVWRTILLMWWLRARYALGAAPEDLARAYR